jgi:ribonuclease Z
MKYPRPVGRAETIQDPNMKLHFLGTGAGNYRGTHRQMSSALVDGILLDCGAGTTGRLYEAGLFDSVDAVLISHLHSDHFAGLFDFLMHTFITGRQRPLTVVSPPGLSPILRAMNDVHAMVRNPADQYDFRLVEALQPELTLGSWKLQGIPLHHSVYDLGYLLAGRDASIYYTGDTGQPSVPDGLRADYVIHESTYADRNRSLADQFGHSTASQAAKAATTLGARRLFLSHIGSLEGTEAEVAREARNGFLDSTVAEDGSQYLL